jgi:hypothetical protein
MWKEKEAHKMTIEITSPDVEALIQQHMQSGAFESPEDLLRVVLRTSEPDTRTGADLVAALRECLQPEF